MYSGTKKTNDKMGVKFDFNSLMAEADKNTNTAKKILEEKSRTNNLIKLNKEKKNAAAASSSSSSSSSLLASKVKDTNIPKNSKPDQQKQLTSLSSKQVKQQPSVASSSIISNKPKSNYDDMLKMADKIQKENAKSDQQKKQKQLPTISSKQAKSKPATSSATVVVPSKPKLSYDEILKMADNIQKDKSAIVKKPQVVHQAPIQSGKKPAAVSAPPPPPPPPPTPPIQSKKAQKAPPTQSKPQTSSSNNNYLSKLKPEQILKLKQKNNPQTSTTINNNNNNNISGWDKAVAGVKKIKTTLNTKVFTSKGNDQDDYDDYDDYDDEEEIDSEMEDFIDDESDDEKNKLSKQEYSKTIREIYRYDPSKYIDNDDDDDLNDMETDFHSQLREEKRSLKLGILEDIEEEKKLKRLEAAKKPSIPFKKNANNKRPAIDEAANKKKAIKAK